MGEGGGVVAEAGGVFGGGGVEDEEGLADIGLGTDQPEDLRVGDLFRPPDGRCLAARHLLGILHFATTHARYHLFATSLGRGPSL